MLLEAMASSYAFFFECAERTQENMVTECHVIEEITDKQILHLLGNAYAVYPQAHRICHIR